MESTIAQETLPPVQNTEEQLIHGEIKTVTPLVPQATDTGFTFDNEVNLIEYSSGTKAIAKPKSGEYPDLRDGAREGTYYQRERASYLVDEAIGFGLIPTTVIRDINGEVSSVQYYIENATDIKKLTPDKFIELVRQNPAVKLQIHKLYILDYLIFSSDRDPKNILLQDEQIFGIDNGLTFGKDAFWPLGYQDRLNPEKTFTSDQLSVLQYDHQFDAEILSMVNKLINDTAKLQSLEDELKTLLTPEEVSAFHHRLMFIHQSLQNPNSDLSVASLKFDPVLPPAN